MRRGAPRALLCGVRRFAEDDSLSDRELLARFAELGDERFFAPLLRRHGPMVFSTCRRVLCNDQDAEDVFQAVFLVLARKAARGWADCVGGWLHEVARQLASEARSREAARRRRERIAVELRPEPLRPEVPALAVLDEELARLPVSEREPLILCYLEGRPREQVARTLGLSLRTLERRLERGRERLRLRLEAQNAVPGLALNGLVMIQPSLAQTQRVLDLVAGAVDPAEPVLMLADGFLKGGVQMLKGKIAMMLTLAVVLLGFGAWSGQSDRKPVANSAIAAPAPKPKEVRWFAPIDPRWRVEVTLLKAGGGDPPNHYTVVPLDQRDPNYHEYLTEKRYSAPGKGDWLRRMVRYFPTGRLKDEIDNIGDEQRSRSWHADGRVAGWIHWHAGKWLHGESFSPDGKVRHRLVEGNGEFVIYGKEAGNRVHRWYSKGGSNFLDKHFLDDRLVSVRLNGEGSNWLNLLIVSEVGECLYEEKGIYTKGAGQPARWQAFDTPTFVSGPREAQMKWFTPPRPYDRARADRIQQLDAILKESGCTWEKLGIDFIRDGGAWPAQR